MRSEIERLEEDIERIENELSPESTSDDPSTVYRYVKRLRSSMAEDELTTKKARLETLIPLAKQLEAELPDLPPRPPPKPRRPRRPLRPAQKILLVVGILAVVGLGTGGLVTTGVVAIPWPGARPTVVPRFSTVEFLPRMPSRPAAQRGETFYNRDLDFDYNGGSVILSGEPPPDGEFWVDDAITILVQHPDGSTATWRQDFNAGCFANRPLPPQDVTNLFRPGRNVVSITLFDVCGANVGTSGPITLSTPIR